MTVKDYVLHKQKALEKNLTACLRDGFHFEVNDKSNFMMEFNTASFEVARKSLLDMFHSISSDGSSNSRHLTHVVNKDKSGLVVTEVLKIKNWNILKKSPLFIGECKITIHTHSATSTFLINGKKMPSSWLASWYLFWRIESQH